jgi:hypothetical protein
MEGLDDCLANYVIVIHSVRFIAPSKKYLSKPVKPVSINTKLYNDLSSNYPLIFDEAGSITPMLLRGYLPP